MWGIDPPYWATIPVFLQSGLQGLKDRPIRVSARAARRPLSCR